VHQDAERPGAQFQVTEQPCLGGEFGVRQGPSSACVLCGRRLATLSADDAPSAIIATGFEQRLRLGQVLYTAGRRSDAVFVMRRGLAKEILDSGYARRVVRLVGPRSVTGLSALVGEPHRHTAVVIGAGLACRIPVAALAEWGGRDLRASARVARLWQQALDDADRLIASYGCGPAAARLARYVLFLTETVGPGARLCRREAAELLGVTPVSVTRLVGDLKRQGLIREQGASLTAWDSSGLQALAAQAEPGRRPGVLSEALAVDRR
jgi:CRP-like cAMP-binding protein